MFSRLSVLLPGCCGPFSARAVQSTVRDPALAQLPLWSYLARADQHAACNGFQQQLAALFNLQPSSDASTIAWAAINRLAESDAQDDRLWLHADPVCMQADMDHAILFDAHSLQLRDDEADQLIAELNAHFSQDGIALQRYSASRWYLSIEADTRFTTCALDEVVGRNVNHFMPTGTDAGVWKRFMNEAQMLLHMSEVNQQREARGHLPVNSVWLWGEGCLSQHLGGSAQPEFDKVFSHHQSATGLAKLQAVKHAALPQCFSDFAQQTDASGHALLVLDALLGSWQYEDVAEWQQQICELDQQWLQPLFAYCARHKISLDLYPCNGVCYDLQSWQRYRFWRRARIDDHLRQYDQIP